MFKKRKEKGEIAKENDNNIKREKTENAEWFRKAESPEGIEIAEESVRRKIAWGDAALTMDKVERMRRQNGYHSDLNKFRPWHC